MVNAAPDLNSSSWYVAQRPCIDVRGKGGPRKIANLELVDASSLGCYVASTKSVDHKWILESGVYGRIVNGILYIAMHPEPGPLGTSFEDGFTYVSVGSDLCVIGQRDAVHVSYYKSHSCK